MNLLTLLKAILRSVDHGAKAAGNSTSISQVALLPNDQVSLVVEGWEKRELAQILSDFEQKYQLRPASLSAEEGQSGLYVKFDRSLPTDQLLFLVNYIHYPECFDLDSRNTVAVARTRVSKSFKGIGASYRDAGVAIYVPSDDIEYDEVYAELDSGEIFRVSFASMTFKRVTEKRQTAAVLSIIASLSRSPLGTDQH